jgi:hypothetical protein
MKKSSKKSPAKKASAKKAPAKKSSEEIDIDQERWELANRTTLGRALLAIVEANGGLLELENRHECGAGVTSALAPVRNYWVTVKVGI